MSSLPTASVIIPTYNRKILLRETLNSLAKQTYPKESINVIIVDDGSTDDTEELAKERFAFDLSYFWQRNQGDAAARNLGAEQSRADILVFLDDDVLLDPGYLSYLIEAQGSCKNRIVGGTWNLWQAETTPLSNALHGSLAPGAHLDRFFKQDLEYDSDHTIAELPFTDIYSNNMALMREAYFEIGMMQGLDFPGSSMWCDLDFAYRAYQQGFEFRRSTKAIFWHRDHHIFDLDIYKKRARIAAYRAVTLFQKHPSLIAHLPMFSDKTPIVWDQDLPRLIARKLARSMASSRLALWSIEKVVGILEKVYPASSILPYLYRYVIGGNVYQGYREGLREHGFAGDQK